MWPELAELPALPALPDLAERSAWEFSVPRIARTARLLMLLPLLAAVTATAEEVTPVLVPYWSEQWVHDDNLFRLPDGIHSPNGSRSDQIRSDVVGIRVDKPFAQQRIRLDTSVLQQHYSNHPDLDFNAVNSSLSWEWTLTPELRGMVLAERKQVPNSFADYRNFTTRNLRTNNTRLLSLDYWLGGGWHLLGSTARISSVSDDNTVAAEDAFTATQRQVGVQYQFPSASSLQLSTRYSDGDYANSGAPTPGLLNAPFDERAHELQGVWKIAAKTTLSGRLTYQSRHHAELPQRDFSGSSGRVDLNWGITDKTALKAGLGRELSTWQTAYSNYIVSDSLYLAPVWQITAKTALTLRIDRSQRRYLGEPFGPPPDVRRDHLRNAQLVLDWQLSRETTLGATLQHSQRDANYPGLDFTVNTLGLNFLMRF